MKALKLFLLLIVNFSFAQSLFIKGILVDKLNHPIVAQTIYLLNKENNEILKTTSTDEKGVFTFATTENKNYEIKITKIDFNDFTKDILVKNENIDLGKIILEDKIKTLEEVVLKGEKPVIQVLADKTIFNVANSLTSKGTNVWELLRKVPGVIIDNNGGIILSGKTGVQIFMDGKPTVLSGPELQSFLESMQSSSIDKLEIITQPSSKYDAAGNAGIINIVYKKDKKLGLNGTVSNAITIGKFLRNKTSVSFNYRNKKNNIYGTISDGFGKNSGFINLRREQNNKEFDAKTTSVYNPKSTNIRVGYDFFSNSKNTFGIILNSNINNSSSKSDSRTPISGLNSTNIDSILVANNHSTSSTRNFLANLNYKYSDTLENSFNIDFDYGNFQKKAFAFQPNFYYNSAENNILSQSITSQDSPTTITIISFQSDYERKLFGGKISTGIKISNVDTNNTFNFFNFQGADFVLDATQSNQFDYKENINAAYFNYKKQTEKWSYQFGLRVENTNSKGILSQMLNTDDQITKRNYTDFFPSGGVTFQYNEKNQLALNYSKRIQRPNYSTLNPFVFKIDELSYSKGNPFLKPQYTNDIKLSNTYNYKLNTSISYSYITDFFAQVTQADGQNRNFISPQNIANQQVISFEISAPQKITKWWNTYLSLNAYESIYSSSNDNYKNVKQKTLSFYAQNTFNLPKKYTLEVSGWFSSPSIWGGTYVTKSMGSLNLAVQKKLMNDKLSAQLAINDILYTSSWRGTTTYGSLKIYGNGGSDSRNVTLSLSYNFGNNEVKKTRNRDTSLEDEKNRVN